MRLFKFCISKNAYKRGGYDSILLGWKVFMGMASAGFILVLCLFLQYYTYKVLQFISNPLKLLLKRYNFSPICTA